MQVAVVGGSDAGVEAARRCREFTSVPTDPATLGLAAASGVVYYALAYLCYVAALRQVPAAVAVSVLPLIPVWGLAAAFLVGDRLSPVQWMGAAIAGLAVLAVALAPNSAPTSRDKEASGNGSAR